MKQCLRVLGQINHLFDLPLSVGRWSWGCKHVFESGGCDAKDALVDLEVYTIAGSYSYVRVPAIEWCTKVSRLATRRLRINSFPQIVEKWRQFVLYLESTSFMVVATRLKEGHGTCLLDLVSNMSFKAIKQAQIVQTLLVPKH